MPATPLLRLVVAALATIALAAGCGGDGNGDDTVSTTEWADGFCSAIDTWTASLESTTDSLRGGNLSEDSLRMDQAFNDADSCDQLERDGG